MTTGDDVTCSSFSFFSSYIMVVFMPYFTLSHAFLVCRPTYFLCWRISRPDANPRCLYDPPNVDNFVEFYRESRVGKNDNVVASSKTAPTKYVIRTMRMQFILRCHAVPTHFLKGRYMNTWFTWLRCSYSEWNWRLPFEAAIPMIYEVGNYTRFVLVISTI